MRKLKLFGCFAVLKCHIFVDTRKKTKQCCRIARLFDAVTAKRGRFKTVLGSTLLCLYSSEHAEEFFVFKKGLDKMRRMGGNY